MMATTAVKVDQKTGHDKVIEFLKGRPAASGAELVKALKLSGTPDSKLAAARASLEAAHAEGRQASVAEVMAAIEEVSPGTLAKARLIAEAGKIRPPARQQAAVEDQILEEARPRLPEELKTKK